jgi:hypothetical protein
MSNNPSNRPYYYSNQTGNQNPQNYSQGPFGSGQGQNVAFSKRTSPEVITDFSRGAGSPGASNPQPDYFFSQDQRSVSIGSDPVNQVYIQHVNAPPPVNSNLDWNGDLPTSNPTQPQQNPAQQEMGAKNRPPPPPKAPLQLGNSQPPNNKPISNTRVQVVETPAPAASRNSNVLVALQTDPKLFDGSSPLIRFHQLEGRAVRQRAGPREADQHEDRAEHDLPKDEQHQPRRAFQACGLGSLGSRSTRNSIKP